MITCIAIAACDEVVADPAHMIPAGFVRTSAAGKTYYASTVLNITSGCDLDTGLDSAGQPVPLATGKAYAVALSAVLAGATATSPVTLIVDLGVPIGGPVAGAPSGEWAIEGYGDHTGFYCLNGANCNGVQNFPATDYASYYVWSGASGYAVDATHVYPAATCRNIRLANFRINGNRGTFTAAGSGAASGNSDGSRDGTLTTYSGAIPDARGSYAGPSGSGAYWLSGIIMANMDGLTVDRITVYNAPTYHMNFYACTHMSVTRARISVADPTLVGNQDGIHVNGGCAHVSIFDAWIRSGDDALAFNIDEGNSQPASDISVDTVFLDNCLAAGRIYGSAVGIDKITIRNVRGSCQWRGFLLGDEGTVASGVERIKSVLFQNIDLNLTTTAYTDVSCVTICNTVGVVEIDGVRLVSNGVACPVVFVGTNGTNPTVGSLRVGRAHLHRSAAGSSQVSMLVMAGGTVQDLSFSGFRMTEQSGQSYADVSPLFHLQGGAIGVLDLEGSAAGAGTVVQVDAGATLGLLSIRHLRHVSHGGSATTLVNNSGTAFHAHIGTLLTAGVAATTGGSSAITLTGSAAVAI